MKPLALLSSLSSGLYLFGSIYAMGSQRLPNVLFILVDDYGIKDVGSHNEPYHLGEDLGEAQALQLQLERTHAAFLNPGWQPGPTWWKSLVPDN